MAATVRGEAPLTAATFDAVLTAAQAGAPWAFERLWAELSGPVAGYLRTQGVRDPDDLVSEVFLGAFHRIGDFQGDEARFRSWVFTIAHHKLIDHRRSRERRPDPDSLTGRHERLAGGDAEGEAVARLGSRAARELIEQLVPDQRDVLLLRIVGDLSIEEVAHALGKSPGAVKQLQRRGLAALRKKISGWPYPFGGTERSRD